MRVRGPGAASLVLAVLAASPSEGGDAFRSPSPGTPCNDVCRWWMDIGKPEAERVPVPPEQIEPRLTVKAIAPTDVAPPSSTPTMRRPASRWHEPARRDHARVLSSGAAVGVPASALPPDRPAELKTANLWGVPIAGSAKVLAPLFVSSEP